MSMGHAKALLTIDNPKIQEQLSELILEKELTVREAEKQSRQLNRKSTQKSKKQEKDVHLEEFEESLQQKFGTKVQIDHTKKGGRITLHYYTPDDLERLLGLL
ncbi:MAG: Stage 0 sporulation protein J [Chlamydiales bacterium]|nr:Stage 0 sporulation protein J [Chlamydiales bacterium]